MIKTFCDPFLEDRRDCHLRPGDIDSALEAFGPGLVKLYINPMYLNGKTKINYTFPEDLEVEGHAGVAGWELMGEIKDLITVIKSQKGVGMSGTTALMAVEYLKQGIKTFSNMEVNFKGTKIPVDKNPSAEIPQNTARAQQGIKPVNDKSQWGRKTPAEENKPSVAHSTACQDNLSLENDNILTKRGFNPSNRKKYPPQKEMLPL